VEARRYVAVDPALIRDVDSCRRDIDGGIEGENRCETREPRQPVRKRGWGRRLVEEAAKEYSDPERGTREEKWPKELMSDEVERAEVEIVGTDDEQDDDIGAEEAARRSGEGPETSNEDLLEFTTKFDKSAFFASAIELQPSDATDRSLQELSHIVGFLFHFTLEVISSYPRIRDSLVPCASWPLSETPAELSALITERGIGGHIQPMHAAYIENLTREGHRLYPYDVRLARHRPSGAQLGARRPGHSVSKGLTPGAFLRGSARSRHPRRDDPYLRPSQ
jgi:hypothetical protein